MRIGELAHHAGTTTRALRFYEAQGLLSARRSANGYREYDQADLRLVREILALQAVGFALEDTRPFVECLRAGHATGDSCPDSIAVYHRKLAEVDGCIDRLQIAREELAAKLVEATARRSNPCPARPAETCRGCRAHENPPEHQGERCCPRSAPPQCSG
jgi:DNA-binding transcriptional MerR regulator